MLSLLKIILHRLFKQNMRFNILSRKLAGGYGARKGPKVTFLLYIITNHISIHNEPKPS